MQPTLSRPTDSPYLGYRLPFFEISLKVIAAHLITAGLVSILGAFLFLGAVQERADFRLFLKCGGCCVVALLIIYASLYLWKLDASRSWPILLLCVVGLVVLPFGRTFAAYVLWTLYSRGGRTVTSETYRACATHLPLGMENQHFVKIAFLIPTLLFILEMMVILRLR